MKTAYLRLFFACLVAFGSLALVGWAQSFNASITGTVTDPSAAVVPGVELTLTAVGTGAVAKTKSGPDGLYSFPNLQVGAYELRATAKGSVSMCNEEFRLTSIRSCAWT